MLAEATRLGLGEPIAISAETGATVSSQRRLLVANDTINLGDSLPVQLNVAFAIAEASPTAIPYCTRFDADIVLHAERKCPILAHMIECTKSWPRDAKRAAGHLRLSILFKLNIHLLPIIDALKS